MLSVENNFVVAKGGGEVTFGDSLLAFILAATGFVGMIVSFGVLVILLWFAGWQVAVGTLGIGLISGLILTTGTTLLRIPYLWFISSIAMWPVGYLLVKEVFLIYF